MSRPTPADLRWTPTLELALWKKLHARRKQWQAGGMCMFFPLTETVGVKLYRRKPQRDFALNAQKRALRVGAAPRCGGTFELHMPMISTTGYVADFRRTVMHGYVTEVARVTGRWGLQGLDSLHRKLLRIGLSSNDAEYTNVGFIGDKLVCIDFDRNSHLVK